MLTMKAAQQVKKQEAKASEHDLLLAILAKLDELVRIQETTRDERFNSQVLVMPASSIQVIEEAVVPKYWAVYVSGTSAASAAVRVFREKITVIPAQGSEVVVLTNGEGFRLPGRSPSISIANTGAASATVIVTALGDANFGKL